jgi:nitrosocyanin
MNNRLIVIVAIVLVIIAGGAYFLTKNSSTTLPAATPTPTQAMQMQMTETPMASPSESMTMTGTPAATGTTGSVKEVTVTGSNYKFAPATITVKKGDTVKITFKNSDGFHDFVIDEFNVHTKTIPAGQTDTVQFVANKAGTYEYYCSVANHRQMGMVGKLIVQ